MDPLFLFRQNTIAEQIRGKQNQLRLRHLLSKRVSQPVLYGTRRTTVPGDKHQLNIKTEPSLNIKVDEDNING